MLAIVAIENGVKKIIPLTADAGSGNPCGTVIAVYSNQVPYGYLPCNGVAFDTAQFPVLYALLGDNHTPDLRECTLKGIGESGRTVGAHVKAGGLAVGEFVDDRVQEHTHTFRGQTNVQMYGDAGNTRYADNTFYDFTTGTNSGRSGATTEVKAVGVNWCIKATSGINENQADNVLSALNEERSYSTEEVNTGKKWIDGKPIYRKVMPILSTVVHDEWSLAGYQNASALFGSNVDTLVNTLIVGSLFMPTIADKTQGLFTRGFNIDTGYIVFEYTKTN